MVPSGQRICRRSTRHTHMHMCTHTHTHTRTRTHTHVHIHTCTCAHTHTHTHTHTHAHAHTHAHTHTHTHTHTRTQEQQSIGYSLPANLLGSAGATIPLAPWEPVSVCTNRTCKENPDKCFQPTQLAPIIHPDDISKKVDTHSVSGVSVPQEASSKPTSVYHGVGSTDSTGVHVQWIIV